jgi:hypothetical protein
MPPRPRVMAVTIRRVTGDSINALFTNCSEGRKEEEGITIMVIRTPSYVSKESS